MKRAYSFKELQPKILKKLEKLDNEGFFGKNTKLELLDGILTTSVQESLDHNYNFPNRALPVVGVIDTKTGQVWFFSLKQLVPEIELS